MSGRIGWGVLYCTCEPTCGIENEGGLFCVSTGGALHDGEIEMEEVNDYRY